MQRGARHQMTINIFLGRPNVSWIIRCCRWVDGKEMIVINDCPPPPPPPPLPPRSSPGSSAARGVVLCTRAKRFSEQKKTRVDRTRPRAKGQGSRLVPRRTCADHLTIQYYVYTCIHYTRTECTPRGVCQGWTDSEIYCSRRHVVARNFIISLLAART